MNWTKINSDIFGKVGWNPVFPAQLETDATITQQRHQDAKHSLGMSAII